MDWIDIALHALVAAAVVALAWIVGWHWYVVPLSSVAFVVREAVQARGKYGRWLPTWRWSRQKLLEAFVPLPVAMVVAGVCHVWG